MKHLRLFESPQHKLLLSNVDRKKIRQKALSINDMEAKHNFKIIEKILKRDCSKFIEDMKDSHLIFRGTNGGEDIATHLKYKKVRNDRKPLSTTNDIHLYFDDKFEEVHNIRLRSNGVFTTKEMWQASGYGLVHIFFPIGEYKCFWHENVQDFWHEIREWPSGEYYITEDERILYQIYGEPELDEADKQEWIEEKAEEMKQEFFELLDVLISEVRQGDIEDVIHEEMVFICKDYYLVDLAMIRFFWDWFNIEVDNFEVNEMKYMKKFNVPFVVESGGEKSRK